MGVTSNGMLCSGDELGLTSDADGILILPDEHGHRCRPDRAVRRHGPRRGREAEPRRRPVDRRARPGGRRDHRRGRCAYPTWDVDETGPPVDERLAVEVREPDLCPRFVGRWVSDVTVGPSPDWVQMRLQAAGMRPISNVVDASNYVMVELGKPIHTFDAAAVRDGRIVVRRAERRRAARDARPRRARPGPDTLVIADARRRRSAIARDHGRRRVGGQRRPRPTSSSSRRSSTRSTSAGRPSATRCARTRACASRRARSGGSPGSARTGRRGS